MLTVKVKRRGYFGSSMQVWVKYWFGNGKDVSISKENCLRFVESKSGGLSENVWPSLKKSIVNEVLSGLQEVYELLKRVAFGRQENMWLHK